MSCSWLLDQNNRVGRSQVFHFFPEHTFHILEGTVFILHRFLVRTTDKYGWLGNHVPDYFSGLKMVELQIKQYKHKMFSAQVYLIMNSKNIPLMYIQWMKLTVRLPSSCK